MLHAVINAYLKQVFLQEMKRESEWEIIVFIQIFDICTDIRCEVLADFESCNTRAASGCLYTFLDLVRVIHLRPCKEPCEVLLSSTVVK